MTPFVKMSMLDLKIFRTFRFASSRTPGPITTMRCVEIETVLKGNVAV